MAKSKKTKIHKKIDGQLLQMNKKFSNLKAMKDIVSMIQKPKRMRIRDIPMTQMVYDAFRKQRELNLMPSISSHTLRHTGCTRLGENNVNPKVMQYVMGHSDARITMNVYNHIAEKSHVENEMSKMNLPETVPAVV